MNAGKDAVRASAKRDLLKEIAEVRERRGRRVGGTIAVIDACVDLDKMMTQRHATAKNVPT